jgi:hypothetical protein
MFGTSFSASRTGVFYRFIAHHSTAIKCSIFSSGRHTSIFKFGKRSLAFCWRHTDQAGELIGTHRLTVDTKFSVRVALVHHAKNFVPQPARRHAAGLEFRVLSPVCRVKLE